MGIKSSKARTVALLGVMSAVLVAVLFIESAIYKIFSYTPPAFLSLGILMTLCLSWDLKRAFLFSTIFGVTSLLCALFIGNPYFLMPWISILPRLFVGPAAYGVFKLIKKATKNRTKFLRVNFPLAVGAAVGILTNTALVITCLSLFFPSGTEGGFTIAQWIELCITLNFPIELVCAVILTPALAVAVEKIAKRFD
jgi:uncharacterized membrane protein